MRALSVSSVSPGSTATARWANYIVLSLLVVWCALIQTGAVGQSGEFIYFKF